MSKKSQTTATFAVTVKVPANSTLQDIQEIIRRGIAEYSHRGVIPIHLDEITVSMTKKVTTYGNS